MSRAPSASVAIFLAVLTTSALAADKVPEKAPKKAAGKVVAATPKTIKATDKDPNVKTDTATNDKANVPDAPPQKGGKARGNGPWGCRVVVDNWTPFVIKTFIDGDFVGTVGRFGDGSMTVGNGATLLYGRAEFNDGTALTWGPQAADCPLAGSYTWKLTP